MLPFGRLRASGGRAGARAPPLLARRFTPLFLPPFAGCAR